MKRILLLLLLLSLPLLTIFSLSLEAALPEEMIYYHLGDLPQLSQSLSTLQLEDWQPAKTGTFLEGSEDYQYTWIMFIIPPIEKDRPAIYLQTITSQLLSAQEYYYNGEFLGRNGDPSSLFGLAREVYQLLPLEPRAQYPVFKVRFFNNYNPLYLPEHYILSIDTHSSILGEIFLWNSFQFLLAFFILLSGLISLLLFLFYRRDRLFLFMGLFLLFSFIYLITFNGIFSLLFRSYLSLLSIISYLTVFYLNASLSYYLAEIIEAKREEGYLIGHFFLFFGVLSLLFYLLNPYSQITIILLYNITTGLALIIGLFYCIRYLIIGEREERIELRIMASSFILLILGGLVAVYDTFLRDIKGYGLTFEPSLPFLLRENYVGLGILAVFVSMLLVATRRIASIYRERGELLENYTSLVQTMMEGLFIMERGVLVFVNSSFCRILGFSEEDLMRRPMLDLVASEHRGFFQEILSRIKGGEKVREYEIDLLSKEGESRAVLMALVQTNTSRETIQGTIRDISRLKEAENLAMKDELTGLYNRRYFNTALFYELHRVVRNRYNLSLLILDLDYFKDYNDTYGHQMGDEALKRVGQKILESTEDLTEYVFRIGGEEFAILLSGYNTERGALLAEELRRAVEALEIPHRNSRISSYLTISIGVVTMSEEVLTEKEFFRLGDEALYEAKSSGRNVVVVYER